MSTPTVPALYAEDTRESLLLGFAKWVALHFQYPAGASLNGRPLTDLNHVLHDLKERVRERSKARWHPIETAPKDGTAFLAYFPSRRGAVARQDVVPINWSGWGGGTWANATSGHNIHDQPTHWMPLPEAPE